LRVAARAQASLDTAPANSPQLYSPPALGVAAPTELVHSSGEEHGRSEEHRHESGEEHVEAPLTDKQVPVEFDHLPAANVVAAGSWQQELDMITVVPAHMVDNADDSMPVVDAQLLEICEVIGADPPPAESAALEKLLQLLEDAFTDSERWIALQEELKKGGSDGGCLVRGSLTCAAAALISKRFTFTFRVKQALVEMHPLLENDEKPGFAAMVEHILPMPYDQRDVLRDVALGLPSVA